MLTKESILAAEDCPLEPVDVPEWNGIIYVPVLSIAELESLQKMIQDKGTDNSGADLAARIIHDESGNRMFDDADAKALSQKSHKVVARIVERFNSVNGIGESQVEDAAKN